MASDLLKNDQTCENPEQNYSDDEGERQKEEDEMDWSPFIPNPPDGASESESMDTQEPRTESQEARRSPIATAETQAHNRLAAAKHLQEIREKTRTLH